MKLTATFLLGMLLLPAGQAFSQVKTVTPLAAKVPYSQSLQAMIVTTGDWTSVKGTARLFERKDRNAKWEQVGEEFPVVVGRSGLGWAEENGATDASTPVKHEGDGKAPAGLFPLTAVFGRPPRSEAVELPYTRLAEFTECVDDVNSSHYNTIVDRMAVGNYDWKSSEKMLAVGDQYDLGTFVAYNTYPVKRGNGSCIFLHVWKDADSGTSGCTAMEHRNIERIVGWLQTAKNPYLVQLPSDAYERYRKPWNLPKLK
jgi:L,D-peptidoglycan transpeptidase YkuD (ErfK/YbiS/YcfS/YnhG family)